MYNSFGRFCDGFFGRYQYGGYIAMAIGLIVILIIGYLVFKNRNVISSNGTESPLDVLQKRYVNGEISEEEYIKKKEILKK